VNGRALKSPSLGSWDMYSVARRGTVMGLQCITLFMLKQLRSISYRMSVMCHGSSYYSCFCCCLGLCIFCSFVRGSLYVVALCLIMALAIASGSVYVDACGRYIFTSLVSLAFDIGEIRRPSGACMRTKYREVGWEVISKAPVGIASRSGLMGWVV
jgi:hypothetical protein